MAKAIDPKGTFEFIFPEDQKLADEDLDRTVWILRSLTPAANAKIQDLAGTIVDEEFRVKTGTIVLETLRAGLVGWRCYRLGDEAVMPVLEDGRITDASIAYISASDRQRLCNAITESGRLDESTAKKS